MLIALFANTKHRLYYDCLQELTRVARVRVAADDVPEDVACGGADLAVSFLSRRILRGRALEIPNVNFHPAPPEYPGVGGASRALYDGAEIFGATAHAMVEDVDAGPIYDVRRIEIRRPETCASLFARAEVACLDLLAGVAETLQHDTLQPSPIYKWTGKAMKRAEFNEWLVLDRDDPVKFARKLDATVHPTLPGPYVVVRGHRFALVPPLSRVEDAA